MFTIKCYQFYLLYQHIFLYVTLGSCWSLISTWTGFRLSQRSCIPFLLSPLWECFEMTCHTHRAVPVMIFCNCFVVQGKFPEAEVEFIKAGKPKEAVFMWVLQMMMVAPATLTHVAQWDCHLSLLDSGVHLERVSWLRDEESIDIGIWVELSNFSKLSTDLAL